tara:strand:+ start:6802 stop:9030 length:2229 start_codon:yes stop_codon:yes gene_type:complete
MSDEPTNHKNIEKTPHSQYKYWGEELKTSIKARKTWWERADKIVARYLGKSESSKEEMTNGFDLNLFHSNTKTLNDMLYGNLPQIDVSRRYAQADDDIGRVASEMMERLLNLDVTNNGTDIDAVFRATLQDRLLGGLGCAKVRYTFESEDVPVMDEMNGLPMADPETGEPMMETKVTSEDAPIDYYFWGDITWGWCRNWAGMPWVAFRSYKTKDEVVERWSEAAAEGMTFKKQTAKVGDEGVEDEESDSGVQKAEIWEIWCKETRSVHWISLGYDQQLEEKEDILGLSGFWPIPPFFMANPTTSLYTPTPDFVLAQDLYNEIDTLQTRIGILTKAVRLVGVYNASADGIKAVMSNTTDNQLVPVENWALFGENGGIAGQIEWMPIEAVVNATQTLSGIRDSTISLLQQITGMTDVMRGALDNQYEGVGQTDQKAKFASVRIQALQEQFASFASNLMQIKAEVIALHFDPNTIYERANMEFSKDQELIQPAIELIKNTTKANLRIQIRPESVAMVDHQALKNERSEFLNAVGSYMQSASVLMAEDPAAKPFVLQLLQWGLAGYKGSSEIEGVIDKAIEATQAQQDEGEKPDPEMQKMKMEMEKEQFKAKSDMDKIQAKGQADMDMRQADMQADIQTMQEQHVRKMAEVQAGMQAKIAELQAALQADLLMEQAQAESNIRQTQATANGEMQKDLFEHELSIDDQTRKTEAELAKIITSANASIEQEMVKAELAPEPKETKGDKS